MRHGLLTLALVGALCLGLTSCGMRGDQGGSGSGGGGSTGSSNSAANGGSEGAGSNSVTGGGGSANGSGENGGGGQGGSQGGGSGGGNGSSANDTGSGGSGNGMTSNGDVGDINNDAIGNADSNTSSNGNTKARQATIGNRTAYDYLNDGKYRTTKDGEIIPRQGSMGIDMTQSVRDLIDDAKQLSREMMQSGGNINAPGTDTRS